jgi:dTDP-glucose 4,6-dehydratase
MSIDKKNYVVTGAAGFIGSHVIDELLKRDDINKIFVIDKLGMGSDMDNIADDDRVKFVFEDIACDRAYEDLPGIDYILHLAAESHVDRSITDPLACVTSNVMGTAKILELARVDKARLVHISTDEVYGHLQLDEPAFTEDTKLAPRSPYSATKAGSDLLVQSYITTFGVNASITRCCNNYGPRQACEKLIPTVIGKLLKNEPIPIYGNGQNIREWIHVTDHAKAIIEVLHTGHTDTVYNIPGSCHLTNLQIVDEIIGQVTFLKPEINPSIEFVEDRAGHDFKYSVSTKHSLKSVRYQRIFDLTDTVDYYLKKIL